MSDTPETDACWDDKECNILEHARRIERERDAERALADRLAEALNPMAWLAGFETPNSAEEVLSAWKEARGERR